VKIILCGYNWVGCKALDILLSRGDEVFVYTHESPDHINDMADFCKKRKVHYSLERIDVENLPFTPDLIASIYYKYIIGKNVINICKNKIINLHPSLLPKYRGCSSLTWAMIKREKKTGYTYHYIIEKVDAGNIIVQNEISIEDFDTQVTLYHRVMFEAIKDFEVVLTKVLVEGYLGYQQQNAKETEFYKRGCPYDGVIDEDWDEDASDAFIRAMIYPPLSAAKFNGKDVYRLEELKKKTKPE
jgi:UDP-4-amino-4-deoxy-L-arabinose formyltransferase/UDP-glucuronic acid dehydrogenase (UDP-4-keto-hexauronic acid decarboxylating)